MKLYQIDGNVVYINDITDIREYVSEDIWEAIWDKYKEQLNKIKELENKIEDLENEIRRNVEFESEIRELYAISDATKEGFKG